MLRREQIIGVVSSWDVRWKESAGCSLLVTDSRVVGSKSAGLRRKFLGLFSRRKGKGPGVAEEAERRAAEIVARKNFELQRDKIVKIIYYEPSMLWGGRLVLGTVGRKVELSVTVISGWNPGILETLKTLVSALTAFAPETFYDEKTGRAFAKKEHLQSRMMFWVPVPGRPV